MRARPPDSSSTIGSKYLSTINNPDKYRSWKRQAHTEREIPARHRGNASQVAFEREREEEKERERKEGIGPGRSLQTAPIRPFANHADTTPIRKRHSRIAARMAGIQNIEQARKQSEKTTDFLHYAAKRDSISCSDSRRP